MYSYTFWKWETQDLRALQVFKIAMYIKLNMGVSLQEGQERYSCKRDIQMYLKWRTTPQHTR